jgi:hypothetical protein
MRRRHLSSRRNDGHLRSDLRRAIRAREERYLIIPVEGSTSIEAAVYDRNERKLRIRFCPGQGRRRGDTYDYLDVPMTVIRDFLGFDSKGRFVNWYIKPHYRCDPVRGYTLLAEGRR